MDIFSLQQQYPFSSSIISGVASGLIINFLARLIFRKQQARIRSIDIASINEQLLSRIRPLLAEGQLPAPDVIDAVIQSLARERGIAKDKVFGIGELCEALLTEVLRNVFITADQKNKYCVLITELQAHASLSRDAKTVSFMRSTLLRVSQNGSSNHLASGYPPQVREMIQRARQI